MSLFTHDSFVQKIFAPWRCLLKVEDMTTKKQKSWIFTWKIMRGLENHCFWVSSWFYSQLSLEKQAQFPCISCLGAQRTIFQRIETVKTPIFHAMIWSHPTKITIFQMDVSGTRWWCSEFLNFEAFVSRHWGEYDAIKAPSQTSIDLEMVLVKFIQFNTYFKSKPSWCIHTYNCFIKTREHVPHNQPTDCRL